jgi:hypothetical protein
LRKKKSKTITSGQTLCLNDIGTPRLHDQHSVGIEQITKNMGRAVVLDQHLIDRLFLEKTLTQTQHLVADKYLELVNNSGAYINSPSFERVSRAENPKSRPLPKGLIMMTVQRIIVDECGREKERRFWIIMVDNPKQVSDQDVDTVSECCDALIANWSISLARNPISLFQRALSDPN